MYVHLCTPNATSPGRQPSFQQHTCILEISGTASFQGIPLGFWVSEADFRKLLPGYAAAMEFPTSRCSRNSSPYLPPFLSPRQHTLW